MVQALAPRCFSMDYFYCGLCARSCGSGGEEYCWGRGAGALLPCLLLLAICLPSEHAEKLHSVCDAESLQMAAQDKSGQIRSLLARVRRRRNGASGPELGLLDAWV